MHHVVLFFFESAMFLACCFDLLLLAGTNLWVFHSFGKHFNSPRKFWGFDGRFAKELAVMKFSTLVVFFSNHDSRFPKHEQVVEQGSFFGMFQGYVECFLYFSTWSFLQSI